MDSLFILSDYHMPAKSPPAIFFVKTRTGRATSTVRLFLLLFLFLLEQKRRDGLKQGRRIVGISL